MIRKSRDYPKEYHGDQKLSDSLEDEQMGSRDSNEFSGESGYNHLARTSKKACVNIPDPSPDPNTTRKRIIPKLSVGADRLTMHSTCHSCRRPDKLCVLCSACPTPFCERCLDVRHGENIMKVYKPETKWLCPKCRPGCGRGCDIICCTCSLCCNKYKKLEPVGRGEGRRMIKEATKAGWNLHDYQIHLQTHESKLEIANRKLSHGWTKGTDNLIIRSNVIANGTGHHLPAEHRGPAEKRRTTDREGSDHSGIRKGIDHHLSDKHCKVPVEKRRTTDREISDHSVMPKGSDRHLSAKRKGPVEKRRTTGDRSDHEGITARVEELMFSGKKARRTIASSQQQSGSRIMKREYLTCQYDHPGRFYKRRQTIVHRIDETICDKEIMADLEKINGNNAWPDRCRKPEVNAFVEWTDRSRKPEVNDIVEWTDRCRKPEVNDIVEWTDSCTKPEVIDIVDTTYKALCNSLIAYADLDPNTYLMRLFFSKEKEVTGNQMSITLTDREMQMKNSIEKRSLGRQIADEFHPAKLKSLPRTEQESMKQKLNQSLEVDLTEYVKKRLNQFYKEVDQQMTKDLCKAKSDIDLAVERMKAIVESKVGAIPRHEVKEEYEEVYSP